jgi:hypothetical protein
MPKFGKKSNTSQDIPTAALPDIILKSKTQQMDKRS